MLFYFLTILVVIIIIIISSSSSIYLFMLLLLILYYFLTSLTRKEGIFLFNDALDTFYLQLYGVGHMVKDHSDSERGNPLPPHGLLFPISSKGSFICTIPQTE